MPLKPTFTADVVAGERSAADHQRRSQRPGEATITFDVTTGRRGQRYRRHGELRGQSDRFPGRDAVQHRAYSSGSPPRHGRIVFSTALVAGEAIANASGAASFTKNGVAPTDPATINAIINNPAGFYFNVHSTLNPGGVVRGQLVKVQ